MKIKFVLICCLLFCLSCKKDDEGTSTNPSTDPSTPTPGVIDNTGGFNIKVDPPSGTNYYIHKTSGFDDLCVVESTATAFADKDIDCIVETEELEGIFHGIDMVLNVPASMCTYVRYYPYFYFGLDYGVGPTAATVRFDKDGKFISGSVTGPGQISADGEVRCNYDYSGSSGPDCCYGTYDLTKVINFGSTDPEYPVTTTVETGLEWPGKPGNCAAGVGADEGIAERDKTYNLPLASLYFKPNGYSQTFTTGIPFTKYTGSIYHANYHTVAPTAFKQAGTFPGNPYYEWTCLDDAYEVKYRIRVQIREWNEMDEFALEATGNPDTTGVEPDWGTPINDYVDWLDVINGGDGFPGMPET